VSEAKHIHVVWLGYDGRIQHDVHEVEKETLALVVLKKPAPPTYRTRFNKTDVHWTFESARRAFFGAQAEKCDKLRRELDEAKRVLGLAFKLEEAAG